MATVAAVLLSHQFLSVSQHLLQRQTGLQLWRVDMYQDTNNTNIHQYIQYTTFIASDRFVLCSK